MPVYDGLRSQLFALGLLTPTVRASARSFGASNSLIWKGLCGANDRNRTSDTVIFSEEAGGPHPPSGGGFAAPLQGGEEEEVRQAVACSPGLN
jgi:hypothetical protein